MADCVASRGVEPPTRKDFWIVSVALSVSICEMPIRLEDCSMRANRTAVLWY
jgi:hypothetical protein